MAAFEDAPDLGKLATQLIAKFDQVAHVEVKDVLFLREKDTKPKALARCYKIGDHPMEFYDARHYCIVVYQANCDYMTKSQLAILLLHEMLHIPPFGDKLVKHDIQDFRSILGIDLDWTKPGRKVPDILGKNNDRTRKKPDLSADKGRAKTPRCVDRSGEPTVASTGNVQSGQSEQGNILQSVQEAGISGDVSGSIDRHSQAERGAHGKRPRKGSKKRKRAAPEDGP